MLVIVSLIAGGIWTPMGKSDCCPNYVASQLASIVVGVEIIGWGG